MYGDHFGFTDQPFQLTPDARFWFGSATHRKAMAYLGYGLAQGEGFIVITGDIGAGKTTLVGHLMETIDETRLTAAQLVTTQVGADDMLRLAAGAFGIDVARAPKSALLERIEGFLREEADRGKRALLIVDEAQNLPEQSLEELRMLSNFQAGGHALLQIFLLGQPEFRERLQQSAGLEQLRQRVIATHHLDPMGADEVEPYIVHRLSRAGWSGRPALTADAYRRLYAETGGLPRKLNLLAGRALLQAAVDRSERIDERAVAAAAADMGAETRPAATVRVSSAVALSGDARLAELEARLAEQDAMLQRVLALLVEWIEGDDARPRRDPVRHSAA